MKKIKPTETEIEQLTAWGFNSSGDDTYSTTFFDAYKTEIEKMDIGGGRVEWRYYIFNNNQESWQYHSGVAWAIKAAYKKAVGIHLSNSLEGF